MSRFDNNENKTNGNDNVNGNINGDGNVVGNNNTVNRNTHTTNEIRNNTYIQNGNNPNQGNPLGLVLAAVAAILLIGWYLMKQFHQITITMEIVTGGSFLLIYIAAGKLLYYNQLNKTDIFRFGLPSLYIVSTLFLIYYTRYLIPEQLIQIAASSPSFDVFYKSLNAYGIEVTQNIGIAIVITALIVIINFCVVINRVGYSFANAQRKGFFYGIYCLSKPLEGKANLVITPALLLLAYLSANGILLNFFK